jgi:hypothetical protein
MPQPGELPDSLKKLTRRQAIEISHTRFDSDAERLTEALSQIEEELRERAAGGSLAAASEERPPPERPAQASAAASTVTGPNSGTPLPVLPEQAKRRSFVFLAVLGLAVVAGIALLLTRMGSNGDKPAALIAPSINPKAGAPPAAPAPRAVEPDQWLAIDDFRAELNQKASAGYQPDMMSGRCEDNVIKYNAHWTQKTPGVLYVHELGLFESSFNARKADLSAQGYALQYQNTFVGCEGRKRYLALWTKSGCR